MLLKTAELDAIVRGKIDMVFRRWRRPSVKAGGSLLTVRGRLCIEAVDPVALDAVSEIEARRAGFTDAKGLRKSLERAPGGQVYSIQLRYDGPDPRLALRDNLEDLEGDRAALGRLDANAPWTIAVLSLIAAQPAAPAQQLADHLGVDKPALKARIRKLKALGLTESLTTGYRLSPRGEAVLAQAIASA